MKTLRRFRFGELGQLEICFERKLAGGWQMGLESNSKVSPKQCHNGGDAVHVFYFRFVLKQCSIGIRSQMSLR
jgi:hypothetical protein